MPGQGTQPEFEPDPGTPQPAPARVMVMAQYTVPATFGQSGGNDTVSLDLSSIDDMGGDDVVVYAASGTTPTSRQNGSTNRRDSWNPAPRSLPSDVAGGSWSDNGNYWVQVIDSTQSAWYSGSVTASSGDHDIVLDKQTW